MSLIEQQAALVAALTGQAPVPPGFDPARVQASAAALARKRAHSVAQVWPSVVVMLPTDLHARFAAYARVVPLAAEGGAIADGRRFAQWLGAEGEPLTDAVRLQVLDADLRFTGDATRWRARRWPCVRSVWLPAARCWLIRMWVPGRVGVETGGSMIELAAISFPPALRDLAKKARARFR